MKNIKLCLLSLLLLCISCTSDNDFENGKHQLEQMGYTNIEKTGHEYFCCGEDDNFSTGFKCEDSNGNIITGCFCSSIGKSLTIRFN